MYKYIEPEVAGGLGDETVIADNSHPPKIKKLHYEFFGWLGDDILETFPVYIVTERLMQNIKKNNLTGIFFDSVKITKSDEFESLFPGLELPLFYWVKVTGVLKIDDFVIAEDHRLLISEKAFKCLNSFNINHASFEDLLQ